MTCEIGIERTWPQRIIGVFKERWTCEYCKTSNKDADTFCAHCGAPRREPEPEKLKTPFEKICEPAETPDEEPSRWAFLRRLFSR